VPRSLPPRAGIAAVSEQWHIPTENLLQPDVLRRVCWSPPEDGDVAAALRAGGARSWQVQLVAPVLDEAVHTSA
jgi:ribonuclease D